MIDFARCRSILSVGGGLVLAVLAINFALLAAAGPFPRWLVTEHIPMGWDFMEANDARIAGILAEAGKESPGADRCFSVYIGKSTARHDIDPAILAANDGLNCRYLCLWGQGEGMHDLDLLVRPLLATELTPRRAVLCLHPSSLAGRAAERLENPLDPFPPRSPGRRAEVVGMIDRCNWIQGKTIKTYINHAIRSALYNTRIAIFDRLRLNWDAFSAPDPDPWRPQYSDATHPRDPEDQVRLRVQTCERLGWFDLGQYDKYRPSIMATLVDVIERFRDRGTEVIIVLMPETTEIRERVPPAARRYLAEDLARAFAEPPVLLDLRKSMPDSMFADHVHLNSTGRGAFSLLLARAIAEHAKTGRGMDSMRSSRGEAAVTDRLPRAGRRSRPPVASAEVTSSQAPPPAKRSR